MDVNLINPFINATLNVLETMAFVKPEQENLSSKKMILPKEMFLNYRIYWGINGMFPSHLVIMHPKNCFQHVRGGDEGNK